MATYSNPHWLLCHIRNSFVSTDDTSMCEIVMSSDDLPKQYLQKYEGGGSKRDTQRRSISSEQTQSSSEYQNFEPSFNEVDFVCYPGLDDSDDEDTDVSATSPDLKMNPDSGSYRFRSNTAQKLEKMNIARRKAAKTKCVNFDDEIVKPESDDYFVRKPVHAQNQSAESTNEVKSKLSMQLANDPNYGRNKFRDYAKFDATFQTGIPLKYFNIYLHMLPEKGRDYPIKICVPSRAKVAEAIGLICYKAMNQFPDLSLKSIKDYDLYMAEDFDDLLDFPPLEKGEPCLKFGFRDLTLAETKPEKKPENGAPTKSMTSEEEKVKLATIALHSLNCSGVGAEGFHSPEDKDDVDSSDNVSAAEGRVDDLEERILSQDDMLEAPVYRCFNLNIIDKKFFKTEVTLGICGERIEIDQQKNVKFWTKQRAIFYHMDAVAHCEIVERRTMKAVFRIWLKTSKSSSSLSNNKSLSMSVQSPTSPGHYPNFSSPFNFLSHSSSSSSSQHMRFKHYDFETTIPMAEQIYRKLTCILEMSSSDVRREFLQIKQRKLEKNQTKKNLKL